MKDENTTATRRPRRLRNLAPLVLSGLALFAATTGVAAALPGQDTVTSGDIVDETIKSKDLKSGSVGGEEIGEAIHGHSDTVEVSGGAPQNGNYSTDSATANCAPGEELLSGSAHWSNDGNGEELFVSEVQLDHATETVTAKGGNDTANNRTMVVVAHCL